MNIDNEENDFFMTEPRDNACKQPSMEKQTAPLYGMQQKLPKCQAEYAYEMNAFIITVLCFPVSLRVLTNISTFMFAGVKHWTSKQDVSFTE